VFFIFLLIRILFRGSSSTLLILIILELFVLSSLVLILYFLLLCSEMGSYYFLVFLCVAACEAALGLSLIVSIIRLSGTDYFRYFQP